MWSLSIIESLSGIFIINKRICREERSPDSCLTEEFLV